MAPHTADSAVKKGCRTCDGGHRLGPKGTAPRTVATALGPIAVQRVDFTCFACGVGRHPADAGLGLDGSLTTPALRLAGLAGGQRSFANAEMPLTELCGWRVRDERIRRACHAEADRIAKWRADPPVSTGAKVPTEFQVDATTVNTFGGWRDRKIGVFAWRACGSPAFPDLWGQRSVPTPTTRLAFAAVEEIEAFAPRRGVWAERLGLTSFARPSVFGDGAEWIGNAAGDRFPGCRGTRDFVHAARHLGAAAALFDEGNPEGRTRLQRPGTPCSTTAGPASTSTSAGRSAAR